MIDLSDPTLDERLQRRTADGRYELGECELVANIRALRIAGNMTGVRRLCEVLLQRCAPVFQRYTQGLRHRPELREEAIANMSEASAARSPRPNRSIYDQEFYSLSALSLY